MTTFRIKHDGQDTEINNDFLQDSSLSFRARGLLSSLLSYPNDWVVSLAHLSKQSPKEGRDAIRSALEELILAGYIVRNQTRNDKGQFDHSEYLIFDRKEGTHVTAR